MHEGGAGTKYLLYTVNPGEGFNLCRDVYIRAANFVNSLRQDEDWVLVLPPWPHLYHWTSPIEQQWLTWDNFFHLPSMAAYVPSVSFDEFRRITGNQIDELIHTQPFENPFEGGQWVEKMQEVECGNHGNEMGWGHSEVRVRRVHCMAAQGRTDVMKPHLLNRPNVSCDHHAPEPSSHRLWEWRSVLGCSQKHDLCPTPEGCWKSLHDVIIWLRSRAGRAGREVPTSGGGPFIAVHLRRRDYLVAHGDVVPSLEGVARQVNRLRSLLNIRHVFLATDAPRSEKERLRQLIDGLVWFEPTLDELHLYMDGGVAIIDQWIAAHSRHFVGTGHSTFSFRIREDRQLMGFSRESTFNSLCGDKPGEEGDIISCEQPSYWPMVEGTTPPREDL
ncbi:hypothetical protein EMCRGX_G004162 [Ephydatia muelleri]